MVTTARRIASCAACARPATWLRITQTPDLAWPVELRLCLEHAARAHELEVLLHEVPGSDYRRLEA